MKRIYKYLTLLACSYVVVLLFNSCQDAAWDDHYCPTGSTATASLMEQLSTHSEFSSFLSLLKQTGGDSLLSCNQTFTVFAPTNAALAGINADANTMAEKIALTVGKLSKILPILLKKRREELFGVLGALNEKSAEAIAKQNIIVTMKQIRDISKDKELLDFFKSCTDTEESE